MSTGTTARPRTRLRLLKIDRVALVDRGDNPEAHVVLSKRAPAAAAAPAAARTAPGPMGALVAELHKRLAQLWTEPAGGLTADERRTGVQLTVAKFLADVSKAADARWPTRAAAGAAAVTAPRPGGGGADGPTPVAAVLRRAFRAA